MSEERIRSDEGRWGVTRRDFLRISGAGMVSGLLIPATAFGAEEAATEVVLRFGLVTDVHYADIGPPEGPLANRYYRESLTKLKECIDRMNEENVAFICETGDFKDQTRPPEESSTLGFLRAVNDTYKGFQGPRYYVLGNHDLDSISKEQFMSITGAPAGYHSFDAGGFHFVILDACFDSESKDYDHGNYGWMDTNIPQVELDWLAEELAAAEGPVIAFVHQRLDGEGPAFVENAAAVREVMEKSGRVHTVFQGHDHAGDHRSMGGIHYYTLKGLVEGSGAENNSYAVVDAYANGDLKVTGYRRADSQDLPGQG